MLFFGKKESCLILSEEDIYDQKSSCIWQTPL